MQALAEESEETDRAEAMRMQVYSQAAELERPPPVERQSAVSRQDSTVFL